MATAVANINFNDDLLVEMAKQYLKKYYDQHLEQEWLTRDDIKQITKIKSDYWIRTHIDNDPYVIANGLKFEVTDGKRNIPRYHKEIREFLKKFGKE
jgi:hypothetical protein